MIDASQIVKARRALGRKLADYRRAAGCSQHQLAPQTLYGRSTIANVEIGRQNVPRDFWKRCDAALQTGGALERRYDELVTLVVQHRREMVDSGSGGDSSASDTSPAGAGELVESPMNVFDRLRVSEGSTVTDGLLDALDAFVAEVSDRYEAAGPVAMAPAAVRQRRWIERLLANRTGATRRQRLHATAGQLSGQLSYMAVNLGRFRSARAYCAEAFYLAELAGDDDLKAWIRGTQSLAAYYRGEYVLALATAQDGSRYARNGRQAVRLAVNGEARALAQLGERRRAEEAIGRAYDIASRFPAAVGMTPCNSLGMYSEARISANAATAHLALGNTAKVLEYAAQAREIVDSSSSDWSRVLVRLDTAIALVRAREPDLERAILLGREAMGIADAHRLESIQQRTRDLAGELYRWRTLPAVSEFLDETRHWLSRDWKLESTSG